MCPVSAAGTLIDWHSDMGQPRCKLQTPATPPTTDSCEQIRKLKHRMVTSPVQGHIADLGVAFPTRTITGVKNIPPAKMAVDLRPGNDCL
ncbi:hypothetical protein CapIbe_006715 [Capra ibex]